MRSIFFNRQDSCHICQMNIALVLHQIPQKIQIFFLRFPVCFKFPEHAVPFIDNDYIRYFRLLIHILHCPCQVGLVKISKIRILAQQLPQNAFLQQCKRLRNIPALAQEILHIQKYRVILIGVLLKIWTFGNFKPRKQFLRPALTTVIGSQHIGSH